jgi:hypothetical protein
LWLGGTSNNAHEKVPQFEQQEVCDARRSIDEIAPMGHNSKMQTVVETHHYVARAEKLLSENERNEVIDSLAAHPLRGDILAGTGGIRKVRFAKGGRGKSGGVRVIYYYSSGEKPIYLLEIFAKNEKSSLTAAERNALAKVVVEVKHRLRSAKP